jgi:hypothetical protein
MAVYLYEFVAVSLPHDVSRGFLSATLAVTALANRILEMSKTGLLSALLF